MLRICSVLGLIGGYVLILRPLRAAFMHYIIEPALAGVPGLVITESGQPRAVFVEGALADAALVAPGGMYFLVPAIILVVVFPRRIYWVYLFLLNVACRLLEWTFQLIGVSIWQPAMHFAEFMHVYLIHGVSLGVVLWLVAREWDARKEVKVPSATR